MTELGESKEFSNEGNFVEQEPIIDVEPVFIKAKRKAIEIMYPVHDPLHDEQHVLEVAGTAKDIADSLSKKERQKVDLEAVELAALYHDSSRKKIGSNLLLVPFFDEKYSGDIAYDSLVEVGYPANRAEEIRGIIRGHANVGGIGRNDDVNSQILSNADKVEVFNPQRFERGLRRFENGQFPKRLLNITVLAMLLLRSRIARSLHFQRSRELQLAYSEEQRRYIEENKDRLDKMLYKPVANRLYKSFDIEV